VAEQATALGPAGSLPPLDPLADGTVPQEAEVLGLVGGDQATNGGPAAAAGAARPVRVELGLPCALLALAEAIDAPHAPSGGRVLAATAVGEPGGLALTVPAVPGEATAADVEVSGPLLLPAGGASLAPRGVR
jgi:hypothetical protein